jgi:hypothetical protein
LWHRSAQEFGRFLPSSLLTAAAPNSSPSPCSFATRSETLFLGVCNSILTCCTFAGAPSSISAGSDIFCRDVDDGRCAVYRRRAPTLKLFSLFSNRCRRASTRARTLRPSTVRDIADLVHPVAPPTADENGLLLPLSKGWNPKQCSIWGYVGKIILFSCFSRQHDETAQHGPARNSYTVPNMHPLLAASPYNVNERGGVSAYIFPWHFSLATTVKFPLADHKHRCRLKSYG